MISFALFRLPHAQNCTLIEQHSRLGGEGIACAQDLMARVRETIRKAPAWIPAENEPKMGDPYMLEPDLQIRESEPVLCLLDDGSQRVGRIMTETDPDDPEYSWHGWIREADGNQIEEVVSWMPLPEATAGRTASPGRN